MDIAGRDESARADHTVRLGVDDREVEMTLEDQIETLRRFKEVASG